LANSKSSDSSSLGKVSKIHLQKQLSLTRKDHPHRDRASLNGRPNGEDNDSQQDTALAPDSIGDRAIDKRTQPGS
jgi:hypothetical protein